MITKNLTYLRIVVCSFLFVTTFLFGATSGYSCSNLTTIATIDTVKSCGLPWRIKIKNNTTGSLRNAGVYLLVINGNIIDSSNGPTDFNISLKSAQSYTVQLIGRDTSGCKDTSTKKILVSSNSVKILSNQAYTYSPLWTNCKIKITDPDSFKIPIILNSNLSSYKIIWGDGQNTGGFKSYKKGDTLFHTYKKNGDYLLSLISGIGNCRDTISGKIINDRVPTAGIKGPPAGHNIGCAPFEMYFTNSSYNISSRTDFYWDWGDLSSDTLSSSSLKDTTYHTYLGGLCKGTVSLIAKNVCGESMSTWNPISVDDEDKANVGVKKTCTYGLPHTFYNQTTDNYCNKPDPKKYHWDFGDGSSTGWITTTAQQSHIYKKGGKYTIRLIADNTCGEDTVYFPVEVTYPPKLNASISDSIGCAPLTVNVKDLSSGLVTKREWDFGPAKSTDSLSAYTYTKGGIYDLKLTLKNYCGTYTTSTKIKVYGPIKSSFLKIPNGCIPYTFNTSNKTISDRSVVKYFWDFGDGTTSQIKSPSHTYKNAGNYKVTLVSGDSCSTDTFMQWVKVNTNPKAAFSYSKIGNCTPLKVSFNNQSVVFDTTISYNWNFGNGEYSKTKHPTNFYFNTEKSSRSFVIKLKATSGSCSSEIQKSITVSPSPKIEVVCSDTVGCNNLIYEINYPDTTQSQYFWSTDNKFNSGSFKEKFLFEGKEFIDTTYSIQSYVISKDGCYSDTIISKVKILGSPKVNFEIKLDSICNIKQIEIKNTSLGAIAYQWEVNENLMNTGNSSTWSLAAPANNVFNTQKVTLKAIGQNKCWDTISKIATTVNTGLIKPDLYPSSGCSPFKLDVNNALSYVKTNIWDLDGKYFSPNERMKTIIVNNNIIMERHKLKWDFNIGNCTDTTISTILVYPAPGGLINKKKMDPCKLPILNMKAASKSNSIFLWQMNGNPMGSGDAMVINFDNPESTPVIHDISLISKNNYGCSDTVIEKIEIFPMVKADFSFTVSGNCTPVKTNFQNKSKNALRYFWNLGDGSFTNEVNPKHNFYKGNNFKPFLVAYDRNGCLDTAFSKESIEMDVPPKANFTYNPLQPKLPHALVTFNNLTEELPNTSYSWILDEGISVKEKNPVVLYKTEGLKNIQLVAIYKGCKDTIYKTIEVEPSLPLVSFTSSATDGCPPFQVQFKNESQFGTTYRWVLGDGNESLSINPVHTYDLSGVYEVELISEGPGGVGISKTRYTITVHEKPMANFNSNKSEMYLPKAIINLENRSEGATHYYWTLLKENEEIDVSNNEVPQFEVFEPGNYDVLLEAINKFGCIDTFYVPHFATIKDKGLLFIPTAFSPNNDGVNDEFVPVYKGLMEENYSFSIFNRWGEEVFATNSANVGWDGTFSNVKSTQGVYTWKLNGQFYGGKMVNKKGIVHLLR